MRIGKAVERAAKRLSFGLLRPVLRRGDRSLTVPAPAELKRVLCIRPEKLGDTVVALPAIQALHEIAPQCAIDLVTSPRSLSLVADDPRLNRVFVYRKQIDADIKTIREIRRIHYDCVIDMIDDDSTTGLFLSSLCARSAVRIGGNKRRYADYYDILRDQTNYTHSIDRVLNLVAPLGVDVATAKHLVPLHLSLDQERTAAAWLRSVREQSTGTLIGFNLSAGKSTRYWSVEKCRELVNLLLHGTPEVAIVLITAPGDRGRGDEVADGFTERVCQSPEGYSIHEVSALLAGLDMVISPDTSLVHIARSFGVPVLGMYPRPEWNLNRWRPYGQAEGVVVSGDDGNIFDITPEQMIEGYRALRSRSGVSEL